MALVIENGSIVANADSYVTTAEFLEYTIPRGITFAGTAGSSEQTLLQAMDYLETVNFYGRKSTKEQSLQWPRSGVYIDDWLVENDEIPQILKSAQIQIALAIDAGNNPSATVGREVKREKVGEIEVEYMDSAEETVQITAVNNLLKKLSPSSGSKNGTVLLDRA
jgi:hypothetical protein